jgi:hypothetical protein
MGSNSKKRQTMAKHAREQAVKQRRALKLEKKQAAATARTTAAAETVAPAPPPPTLTEAPEASHQDGKQLRRAPGY